MSKKKNILFLTSWYPNKEDSTLGIFVQRHAQAAALFHNVHLLFVSSKADILEPEITTRAINGFTETVVFYPKVKTSLPILSSIVKLKRYIKYHLIGFEEIKKQGFSPDICHCNIMDPSGLAALKFKNKFNIPFVVTEHWTGYLELDGRYNSNPILKRGIPKIGKKAAAILPVSEDLKNALLKHQIGSRLEVIRNVVDINQFNYEPKEKSQFLVVTDLENNQKNISGIINSFKVFQNAHPNIQLVIAGGGPDELELKQQVTNLQLSNSIRFLGRINAEQISQELNQSFALVLFSNYENLPCVIIESFACGTPVVSTDVGGISEIINEERGILISAKNTVQLTQAFQDIMNTNWDQSKIRKYAVDQFSLEVIGKKFDQVYQSVVC